jgi:hypothetical protein
LIYNQPWINPQAEKVVGETYKYLAVRKEGEMRHGYLVKWAVDHVPTGFKVATFSTREQARKFVRLVRHLDWSFTDPEDGGPKEAIRGPVKAAKQEALL